MKQLSLKIISLLIAATVLFSAAGVYSFAEYIYDTGVKVRDPFCA